jgi:BASS family bile acid:Na+ symporter
MLKKILSFYTKYFAVWVVAFGIAAYLRPDIFIKLEEGMTAVLSAAEERVLPESFRLGKGMNWFFALTMFGIGAVLEVADFKRIAQRPTVILIGSAAQFSIMPLGAFVLAKLFNLPPEIAVGLILTGSAPGAMASNVMSYIAKADTAYSVSLTTVSTLLCPLLTPGLTFILARSRLEVQFLEMVGTVVKMVVVPLFIGFGVRHYLKEKIEKILPVFPAISVTFIIFICSLVIALNKDYLSEVTGIILAAAVILNVYGMLAGYGVGSAFRMDLRRRRTLAIEIGMQNAGLGTVLALNHFGKEAAMPAAIFVFICIITASLMAAAWQRTTPDETRDRVS